VVFTELRRYVIPAGKRVLLDEDGFLLSPSEHEWTAPELHRPIPVRDLLLDPSSFVILAAGGAGKTTTCMAMAQVEQDAKYINVEALTRDNLERKLAGIDPAPTYLDGLDQAALADPRFLHWLEELLTTPEFVTIPWRLACRSAAWDSTLSGVLRRTMPGFREWSLLPLDREAAEKVVSYCGFNGPEFIRAIVESRLGNLAAGVGQLIAAATYWQEHGRLATSAVQATEFEVNQFLTEPNKRRRPAIAYDRARCIAGRLGAFSAFAAKQIFSPTPTLDSHTFPADQLPSDAEPTDPNRPVEPDEYRAVIDTALFSPGPPGTVMFRHQRYPEFLAAKYLMDRDASPLQVRALLAVHANGRLPAARLGVAAWLSVLKPELVLDVIKDNALMFAQAAVTAELPVESIKAVVTALLESAAREEQPPEWTLDLAPLRHSGLSDQLIERLSAGPATSEELWWIARLAAAGRCSSVAPALAETARNSEWPPYARRAAVTAVGALTEDALVLRSLFDLADPERADDPDNEVLAAVIDVLYPRVITTSELLQVMRPQRTNLIGGYRMTTRVLGDRVPEADLAEFTNWLASAPDDSDSDGVSADLFNGLITRTWSMADDSTIRDGLARLLVSVVRSQPWRGRLSARDRPWLDDGSEDLRRRLAIDVAANSDQQTWYAVLALGLLTGADTEWLTVALPSLPAPAAPTLRLCLPRLAASAEQPDIDDEPQDEMDIDGQLHAKLLDTIERLSVEPSSWWRVNLLLAADGHGSIEALAGHDLTQRPGWPQLTPAQQDQVLHAGIHYLRRFQPNIEVWAGKQRIAVNTAVPDWSGVHLMATLLRHRPDALVHLETWVWRRWSDSAIATWIVTNDNAQNLRLELLDRFPDAARPDLVRAALDHLDRLESNERELTPREVYDHLAVDLAPSIAEALLARRYSRVLAENLLDLLVKHGSRDSAFEVCRQLSADTPPSLAARARAYLAELDPNGAVDRLISGEPDADEISRVAGKLRVSDLDCPHLVAVAALLLDRYPYADDPPINTDAYFSRGGHVRGLRQHVLQELATNGHSDELVYLRIGRPDHDRQIINHYLNIAQTRQAELAVTPTDPADLMHLLRRGDARLVRDDTEFLDVLVEQFDLLQHELRHKNAFREIWDDTRPQVEDDITDWVERRLSERLSSDLVVDREVQVARPKGRGIGTRVDLNARMWTTSGKPIQVVIEAKRIDNAELMTAMHNQLIDRYLVPEGLRHGIYLVYWITPVQCPTSWSRTVKHNLAELELQLTEQAEAAAGRGFTIRPYILDVSRADQPEPGG
jgi:hypothetical protein